MMRASARVLLVFLAAAVIAWGQGNLGGLTGLVTDPTEAVIGGATVTLTSLSTGAEITVSSTGNGVYLVRGVPPGSYILTVTSSGFKTYSREPVLISTATVGTLHVRMEVGTVTESITVVGGGIQLQTSNAEVGTLMESKAMLDLPISLGGAATIGASGRRQPENFIFLTPGVTGNQWSKSINGAPGFSMELLYEGVSAQGIGAPGFLAQTSPPYEAVDEFKVQNALYPVEYGRGFGVINFTLKSGTNELHGDLYEFFRNDQLDASGFFNATRPIVRQNEFGGSAGGPLYLPKIYDGRNRTFFNFNYTGFELRGGAVTRQLVTLPTMAFRQGDFSGYPFPIFDPATQRPDAAGGFERDRFPNNAIPQSRIGGVASRTIPLIPALDLPNQPFNNFVSRQNEPNSDKVWSIKIDHIINDNQRLAGSFWWAMDRTIRNGPIPGELDRSRSAPSDGGGLRLSHDYTITPTLLNHFGFGYTPAHPGYARWLRDSRRGNETLQIKGIPNDVPGFSNLSFTNNNSHTFGNAGTNGNDPAKEKTWSIVNQVTWIKGNHQLKFGGDWKRRTLKQQDARNEAGSFSFHHRSTSQPNSANFDVWGNSFATFLLGDVFSSDRNIPVPIRFWSEDIFSVYGEDSIKLGPDLTLTLGLRWDIPNYAQEEQDRVSRLNLALPNEAAGGRPGALEFLGEGPGRTGTRNALGQNYYKALSPRISLAYSINPRTVLRAGYGVFHMFPNIGRIGHFPFFGNGFGFVPAFSSLDQGITPAFNIDRDGFPDSGVMLPSLDPTLINGGRATAVNGSAHKTAINQSLTFSIQRELPGDILLDVAYVGSKANHLPSGLENVNQVHPDFLSLGNVLNADINSQEAQAAGITAPFPGFQGSVSQALRPFPQYIRIDSLYQPTGFSNYNSLQVRGQKRYATGFTFLLAYTFSKALGVSGDSFGDAFGGGGFRALNTFNRKIEKAHTSLDQSQVFVLSWIYELPFGRGKRYLSDASPVVDEILGGWQFNMIHRYQSSGTVAVGGGPPLPIFGGGNRPLWVSSNVRSSVSMGDFDPATDRYLNIDAFAQPAAFTFGNAPRRIPNVRAPALYNEDFSIFKNILFTEAVRLQFRAEFFNLFNRTVFGGPQSNVNNPVTFGRLRSLANTPRSIQFGLKLIF